MLASDTTPWVEQYDFVWETHDDFRAFFSMILQRRDANVAQREFMRAAVERANRSVDFYTERASEAEYELASLALNYGPVVLEGTTYTAEIVTEFGETYPKLVVRSNGTWEASA